MTFRSAHHPARMLAALVLAQAFVASAWSQAHAQDFGAYLLRSSTVNSEALSVEVARKHGIERDPQVAVLEVVVLKKEKGRNRPVPARVEARATPRAGVSSDIEMRETPVQGQVAYIGTYQIQPREVFDITIKAWPEGSKETLTMTYRDRRGAGTKTR